MKLNNKGFAITTVIYGLLILFVFLVASYLVVLSAKKDRLEDITSDIEKSYTGNTSEKETLAEHITNLYTNATKSTVTNNGITYNYASSVSLMNDRLGDSTVDINGGNIRYYGTNPNNYIYFNCSDYSNQSSSTCETWKIIGVFNGRVKIMRNSIIGSYSWDYKVNGASVSYKNNWSEATLMTLLNGAYYNNSSTTYYNNSTIGTSVNFSTLGTGLKNDTTRNLIADVSWNLGGWDNSSYFSNEAYKFERSTNVYTGNSTSWNGKIALVYPSDYGYAVDFNHCNSSNIYQYSSCRAYNWMAPILATTNFAWLLMTDTSYPDYASAVAMTAAINPYYDDYKVYGVVPTLYLNSDVMLENGSGTSSSPYKLIKG